MTAADAILNGARAVWQPGSVTEVRAPQTPRGTQSGYFNAEAALVESVRRLDDQAVAAGIYGTINPVHHDLLARRQNRLGDYARDTTQDSHILRRIRLLVDLDADRPSGISATDEEHDAALGRAEEIRAFLGERGWPLPLYVDSGNGSHLIYAIDLPNDSNATKLVQSGLKALSQRFSDARVKVDESVFNAARIVKIPGTMARKGDDVPERPHRRSRILDMPADFGREIVSEALLVAIVAELTPKAEHSKNHTNGAAMFDLDAFIARNLRVKRGPEAHDGGVRWIVHCPFNPDHGGTSAAIIRMPSGAIVFRCQHNGCRDRKWAGIRELYEPRSRERREQQDEKHTERASAEGLGIDRLIADRGEFGNAVDRLLADRSDAGNADWFVACNKDDVIYRYDRACWLVFDGVVWRQDRTGQVNKRAEAAMRELLGTAAKHDDATKLAEWATKSLSRRRLEAMVDLARYKLPAPGADQIDAAPMLLAVANGVIDLRTGKCRASIAHDYLSRATSVAYDQAAKCPTWLAFLSRIFADDRDLLSYVQRAVGYSLTGSTAEQVWFLLHGSGANGKSKLQETLVALLGEYAQAAGVETFLERRDRSSTSDLARLDGARVVIAAESDENRRLAAGIFKQLTGGDKITARFQYGNEFEFVPRCKVWLATNHRPRITDTSTGMWRRVQYLPFNVVIPEPERDLHLGDKLAKELPGILNWAIEGVLLWQEHGLRAPSAVVAATQAYRTEEDPIADFLAERCDVGTYTETVKALFCAYQAYAAESQIAPREQLTQRSFGDRLDERGYTSWRGAQGKRFRQGLRVKPRSVGDVGDA